MAGNKQRRFPWWAGIGAVVIIAGPAAVTNWAGWWEPNTSGREKAGAFIAWLAIALIIVFLGLWRDADHEERVRRATASLTVIQDRNRSTAFGVMLNSLLSNRSLLPDHWEFTVYVYVEARGRLEPAWPLNRRWSDDVMSFAPGNGATGLAWGQNGVVIKYGAAVHDSTHNLTPEQQQAFAGFRTVVSTAIFSDGGTRIGALSGICVDEDPRFDDDAAQATLMQVADAIGVLLTLTVVEGG